MKCVVCIDYNDNEKNYINNNKNKMIKIIIIIILFTIVTTSNLFSKNKYEKAVLCAMNFKLKKNRKSTHAFPPVRLFTQTIFIYLFIVWPHCKLADCYMCQRTTSCSVDSFTCVKELHASMI